MNKQFSPFLQRYFLKITEVFCNQIRKYRGIFKQIITQKNLADPMGLGISTSLDKAIQRHRGLILILGEDAGKLTDSIWVKLKDKYGQNSCNLTWGLDPKRWPGMSLENYFKCDPDLMVCQGDLLKLSDYDLLVDLTLTCKVIFAPSTRNGKLNILRAIDNYQASRTMYQLSQANPLHVENFVGIECFDYRRITNKL